MSVDGNEEIQKLNLLRRLQAAKKLVTEPLARLREVRQRQAADLYPRHEQVVYPRAAATDGAPSSESTGDAAYDAPMEIYMKASLYGRLSFPSAASGRLLFAVVNGELYAGLSPLAWRAVTSTGGGAI